MDVKNSMPAIREVNGRKALFVDGKPFIMLGLQWDCDWCYSPDELDRYFAQAQSMNLNTASLLLYWNEVEPEKDRYDFSGLDHRLELARKYNLRVILVWFASFKNAGLTYAPDYIRSDHATYRKTRGADGSLIPICCCPTSENIRERDEKALRKIFEHLKEVDGERHTVILFQMENETGIMQTDRCHCETCDSRYVKEGWADKYGLFAPEAFTAAMIADYCDGLTACVKEIYPLPVYVNAALPHVWVNSVPGNDWKGKRPGHFNGGPVGRALKVWRERVKHIDFISPDIYQPSRRDFAYFCREYTYKDQPLFIPECATGTLSRVEKNVVYAIGEFSAIGIDPWSITRSCPDFMGESLVNPSDGVLSEEARELAKSYKMTRDIMIPLALAQNSERLKSFVQEPGEFGVKLQFDDIWLELCYEHPKDGARGYAIRLSQSEFLVSGCGVHAAFSRETGEQLPIASVEIGRFEGEEWKKNYVYARESVSDSAGFALRDCMTALVKLGRRIDWINV